MGRINPDQWPPAMYTSGYRADDGTPVQSSIKHITNQIGTDFDRALWGWPHWMVGILRSKRERSLMELLTAHNISYFLPLIKYHRSFEGSQLAPSANSTEGGNKGSSGSGSQFLLQPLFPGYIFIFGNNLAQQTASDTRHIAAWIPVTDQWMFQKDMIAIETCIDAGEVVLPSTVVQGSRVEVKQGHPLEGMFGYVDEVKPKTIILRLTGIPASYSVQIDPKWLMMAPSAGVEGSTRPMRTTSCDHSILAPA